MTSLADHGLGSGIQEAPGSDESFCICRDWPKSECSPSNNRLRSTGRARLGQNRATKHVLFLLFHFSFFPSIFTTITIQSFIPNKLEQTRNKTQKTQRSRFRHDSQSPSAPIQNYILRNILIFNVSLNRIEKINIFLLKKLISLFSG